MKKVHFQLGSNKYSIQVKYERKRNIKHITAKWQREIAKGKDEKLK